MNMWICSITRAELRVVVHGLQLAWEFGYKHVQVQLDSQATIQFLLAEDESTYQHSFEVAQFQELLDRDWMVEVEHIYWEGNQTADF
ncbi:Putative ribonuclease H protein At1g65750 [Linum grandiflorum]